MTTEFQHFSPLIIGFVLIALWVYDFFIPAKKNTLYIPQNIVSTMSLPTQSLTRGLCFITGILGLVLMIYGSMEPRMPSGIVEGEIEALDIFLVVDVSRSMLAEDMEPNRLEVTKQKLREFAMMKPKDRISLILFSEKIFTLLPPTTDPDLVLQSIDKIDVGYLGSGTNIGDALGLAVARAQLSEADNKVIILLTDGVSNVGNLTPLQAADQAVKFGYKVYTIGVGTEDDAKLPVGSGLFGKRYVTIPGGGIDFETLQEISDMTNAKMYKVDSESAFQETIEDIDQLERSKIKSDNQVIYEELYYKYMLWGILLFLISEAIRRLYNREWI